VVPAVAVEVEDLEVAEVVVADMEVAVAAVDMVVVVMVIVNKEVVNKAATAVVVVDMAAAAADIPVVEVDMVEANNNKVAVDGTREIVVDDLFSTQHAFVGTHDLLGQEKKSAMVAAKVNVWSDLEYHLWVVSGLASWSLDAVLPWRAYTLCSAFGGGFYKPVVFFLTNWQYFRLFTLHTSSPIALFFIGQNLSDSRSSSPKDCRFAGLDSTGWR